MQLPLVFDIPVYKPPATWQNSRTPQAEASSQKILEQIRQETSEIMAVAQRIYPEECPHWDTLRAIPTEQLQVVCSEYYLLNPLPIMPEISRTPAKPKPWQPWTIERKRRNRIRRLEVRLKKRWAIPELFIKNYLDACASNPQMFGLCLLPTASDRCPVAFDSPQKIAALELESRLREKEMEEYKDFIANNIP